MQFLAYLTGYIGFHDCLLFDTSEIGVLSKLRKLSDHIHEAGISNDGEEIADRRLFVLLSLWGLYTLNGKLFGRQRQFSTMLRNLFYNFTR